MKDKTIDQMRHELMSAKDRQKNLERFLKGSKVKQPVYHGTNKDIHSFKVPENALGLWASKDPQVANEYSTISARGFGNPTVYPLHVKLKNPANKKQFFDAYDLAAKDSHRLGWKDHEKRHREILQNQGFDGAILDDSVVAFQPHQVKSAIGNRGTYDPSNPDITMAKGGSVKEPKKTVKAYKLFRVHKDHPGKLFPLFVDANTPVEMGKWVDAKEGEMKDGKVKSKIGNLAYRPGWHAGDLPIATHIGEKSDASLTAPDRRPANHAWAEVEMPDDVDWQSEANRRGTNAQGKLVPVKAHITDQIPHGGHYRYKTNPNMTGNWLIGGSMKVNRVLSDAEVAKINKAAGLADLPREQPFKKKQFGFKSGGTVAPDEWKAEEHVNYGHGGVIHMADGGAINQGGGMPTLAEMRLALMRQNPVNLKNIGVNEATNMDQKVYLPPNRQEGVMHAGGVDMSHEVPGQQLMPLLPGTAPGQPGVPGQPPTGMPQGQMPGAQASPLPAGFNTQAAPNAFPPSAPQPQPPSNILSMLPQGRALNAMQPTKMPAMASGGSAKTYTHEVFNRKTGETKGQYQSIETARKARDRYDNQYGAYVHDVRPTGNVKPRPFENSKQALLRDLKSGTADQYMTGVERFQQRAADRLKEPKFAAGGSAKDKAKKMVEGEKKATRIKIDAEGPGGVKGIVVPRHMLEGNPNSGVEGMNEVNKARAKVYGSENRDPLTLNKIGKIHKETLAEHFQKPVEEQVKAEQEALARLRAAKHIGKTANTLDESEKLDTVRHEHDEEGRTHVGYASKGVAGHALYTSGHGENEKRHVINTCPGQTTGCGGGVDESGVVDTKKGTCFAPNAESQYPAAAVRRTAHEQAKHDPAMTRDWILAHTGSMREAANRADKSNKRMLFRPNVVDETDVSSRHVIRHLNEQRKAEGKPGIVANSYGKTNELHDPENGYHVTHSNVGPKVKHGREISENIGRDKQRVRNTITATSASGEDFKNEQGNHTPPKGSYMVTDVKRGSQLAKNMEKHITHAKYWSTGREQHELTPEEKEEGEEGHFGPNGKPTTPDKSHYGHTTVNGRRYDYQRQHILHPRLVQVGENKDGTPHMIPTDSRFKDTEFLPKKRFQTKNGKDAGHILMTTPTESTSNLGHETSFTHNVTQAHIEHAQKNKGEYEIDKPEDQEKARGKEYAPPQPIKFMASGGYVSRHHGFEQDDYHAFPEQNLAAQRHLAKRMGEDEERKERKPANKKAVVVHKDLDTMRYEMMTKKGK